MHVAVGKDAVSCGGSSCSYFHSLKFQPHFWVRGGRVRGAGAQANGPLVQGSLYINYMVHTLDIYEQGCST
jgi:hypothetical protein